MYSERLMTLFREARHGGSLAGATHRGAAGVPHQGPYLLLWLRVEDGIVREARFQTYGCPAAIGCSEAVCAWSEGRPLAELVTVTAAEIAGWVDGVPPGKEHCPVLAAQAVAQVAPLS